MDNSKKEVLKKTTTEIVILIEKKYLSLHLNNRWYLILLDLLP